MSGPNSDPASDTAVTVPVADQVTAVTDFCLLVGVSRQASLDRVLDAATALAGPLHARLVVVHVVNLVDYPVDPDLPTWESEARSNLDRLATRVTRRLGPLGLSWSYQERRGGPAQVLADAATQASADIIVVGATEGGAVTALSRLGHPSVSRALTVLSTRPVLVVPRVRPPRQGPTDSSIQDTVR